MKLKLAKVLRVYTTAPFMALLLCTLLQVLLPGSFAGWQHYLAAVFFLSVLPLLAYPVAALIPALRKKGRPFQRSLAIVFSLCGYVGGMLFSLLTPAAAFEQVLYGTYLISGVLIAACSFLFHFKASGHACGVAGPIAMLITYLGPLWGLSIGLLALVFWASVKMGRHTLSQLVTGSLIPIAAMFMSIALFLH